jgi:hypothetical protein
MLGAFFRSKTDSSPEGTLFETNRKTSHLFRCRKVLRINAFCQFAGLGFDDLQVMNT